MKMSVERHSRVCNILFFLVTQVYLALFLLQTKEALKAELLQRNFFYYFTVMLNLTVRQEITNSRQPQTLQGSSSLSIASMRPSHCSITWKFHYCSCKWEILVFSVIDVQWSQVEVVQEDVFLLDLIDQ